MQETDIKAELRRAERVLNGDTEYDGADAARIIEQLCNAWLVKSATPSEKHAIIAEFADVLLNRLKSGEIATIDDAKNWATGVRVANIIFEAHAPKV